MSHGIFPDKLKIGKVIPVFKNGKVDDITNYRPISVLPLFSKIFEKCLYNRLHNFLSSCNILSNNQYGFRMGHSASMALLDFIDKVSTAIDSKEYMIGFLDLSKAFDTLDHSILLRKLYDYGIRGVVWQLFKNYLSNRSQFVSIDNHNSSFKSIRCGVPQGSILGPLLFLIYINDICNSSQLLQFILFADDTSVFISNNNIITLVKTFNEELIKLNNWLVNNRLVLNNKKTQYLLFTKKKIETDDLIVKFNNHNILRVSSVKFLGVHIDDKLTWHEHIGVVCNRTAKGVGILYRLRHFPRSILTMIYYALIISHINYCNVTWSNCTDYYMTRLFLLQKKAVRIISNAPYNAHTLPIFYELQLLNVYDINNFNIAIFMFMCSKGLLPPVMMSKFSLNSSVHHHNTRNSDNYHLPQVRTNISKNTIFFKGPILWNYLPSSVKNTPTLNSFKRAYKSHLVSLYSSVV